MQLIVAKEKRVRNCDLATHLSQVMPPGIDREEFEKEVLESPKLTEEQVEEAFSSLIEDTVMMTGN